VWHAYHNCRNLRVYNCCFGQELLQCEFAWLHQDPVLSYLLWAGPLSLDRRGLIALHLPPRDLRQCRHLLDSLRQAGLRNDLCSRVDQVGYMLLFLGRLLGSLEPEHRTAIVRTTQRHPAVTRAMELLESRVAHNWSLDELSRNVRLERSYLVRLFKTHSGLPPMNYLSRCRAERAAALLVGTDYAISEIGRQIGWPDSNYFARRFRGHYGIAPREYRKRFAKG